MISDEPKRKYPGQNIVWTDNIQVELPIRVGTEGIAAFEPSTVINEWKICLQKYAKDPALSVKRNKKWITWNFTEYH